MKFQSDFPIFGKEAGYIRYLVDELKVFSTFYDAAMAGAVLGVLYERTSEDRSNYKATIFADKMNKSYEDTMMTFRLVILTQQKIDWTNKQRVDICFRYNTDPHPSQEESELLGQAVKLFISYIKGGLDILFEAFQNRVVDDPYEIVSREMDLIGRIHKLSEEQAEILTDDAILTPSY